MPFSTTLLLLATLAQPAADETPESTCDSLATCNTIGTAAYKAGRHKDAAVAFERQVDYADTAIEALAMEDKEAGPKENNARELALNNAVLAYMKGGECLKARVFLKLADAAHGATQANAAQLDKSCGAQLKADSHTGDYWQYVGHGSFNNVTLNQGANGDLILDAFWMRISRGPMDTYGPAAFGSLAEVSMEVTSDGAKGLYNSYVDDKLCELNLKFLGQAIEIDQQTDEECNIGGAGAYLGGRYELVSTTPSPPQKKEDL